MRALISRCQTYEVREGTDVFDAVANAEWFDLEKTKGGLLGQF